MDGVVGAGQAAEAAPNPFESKRGIEVRRARVGDFLGIAALDREAWSDNADAAFIPDGEHAWRHWVEGALVFCAVAEEGKDIVGAALAFPYLDGHFCLHKIFVAGDRRAAGIGSRLMERLLGEIDARERDVFLTVNPSNAAAIALYERWGFRERRFVAGYYRACEDRLVLARRGRAPAP